MLETSSIIAKNQSVLSWTYNSNQTMVTKLREDIRHLIRYYHKILKIGAPNYHNTYHNCPKMEQFGFTMHLCVQKMHMEWKTV